MIVFNRKSPGFIEIKLNSTTKASKCISTLIGDSLFKFLGCSSGKSEALDVFKFRFGELEFVRVSKEY